MASVYFDYVCSVAKISSTAKFNRCNALRWINQLLRMTKICHYTLFITGPRVLPLSSKCLLFCEWMRFGLRNQTIARSLPKWWCGNQHFLATDIHISGYCYASPRSLLLAECILHSQPLLTVPLSAIVFQPHAMSFADSFVFARCHVAESSAQKFIMYIIMMALFQIKHWI